MTVLAAQRDMPHDGETANPAVDTPLVALPRVGLPLSRAMLERIWWATNWPKVERFVPYADWVYAPADAYVPTRKALFASTIHDVEIFEEDLPWARRPGWEKAQRNWRLRLGAIIKHADLIATVSEFSKSRIVALLGADPEKVVVVGNGVDPSFFEAAGADAAAEEARVRWGRYLITVGGLYERKGAPYLLDLADALRERGSDLKILICGTDEPRYRERLIATPNVHFLHVVPDEKLFGLLRGAVASLLLSRYEGFGIPVLEAMAIGTPAIVSQFASLPEVAGDAGIVVDVHKPAEVAATVSALADDAQRREELIRRGHARAGTFTWEACVTRLLDAMATAQSK